MQVGLKTGMYYLRTKAAASAIQFTVDKTKLKVTETQETENEEGKDELDQEELKAKKAEEERKMAALICSRENKDDCMMCGA